MFSYTVTLPGVLTCAVLVLVFTGTWAALAGIERRVRERFALRRVLRESRRGLRATRNGDT